MKFANLTNSSPHLMPASSSTPGSRAQRCFEVDCLLIHDTNNGEVSQKERCAGRLESRCNLRPQINADAAALYPFAGEDLVEKLDRLLPRR